MSGQDDSVLSMQSVSKKFRRGELYDSLRDLVPNFAAKAMRRPTAGPDALREKEFWALRDVSFNVSRGEALGIVGSNGAGKSTILKLLSGIMRPTHGTVTVRGRLSALIEVGAGFHGDLTGRENIYLNGTILGMTKDEIRRKLDDIVEFAGIGQFLDTPAKRYSSGMYARLGFAIAAHVEPDLLIVDEVLSVGDYLFQQKCMDRMGEILQRGTTVLFVSHNLHAVTELCRRSILLEKGRLIATGPTDEVIRQYIGRQQHRSDESEEVEIRSVVVRNRREEAAKFESMEKAFIDLSIVARRDTKALSVLLQIVDDSSYPIFQTSNAFLNGGVSVSLAAGEELNCSFEVNLQLGAGTYHVNVYAQNDALGQPFSIWRSAASFFVGETLGLKGAGNLNPRLEHYEIRPAPSVTPQAVG